ncbi:MAG: UDP-N-acetylmuramoyl-L-alanyl-D-glutamate--2,6-diaminopimelate ligase [Planctomycetes bacterium]|nr:UDP-N-acetylmuramoyl-L-alanyl-D-glutamate--2,6-diaminopimelate ligase [Planctomycetota bacterium]
MVRIHELAARCGGVVEGPSVEVVDVELDSRRVMQGALFAALPGAKADGSAYSREAIARGATAVLTPTRLEGPSGLAPHVAQWIHPDARRIVGAAAAEVHGRPSGALFVAGVTGTNGKTTVAHLVGQLLAGFGRTPAVLGTAGNKIAGGRFEPATHTTLDAPSLQRLLAAHRRAGGDSVALEISSHALDQDRHAGLELDVAVFTNLTRDHLDYHGDFERYAAAKEKLFSALASRAKRTTAVVNADDPASERMAAAARSAGATVFTFSTRSRADLCASDVVIDLEGTQFSVHGMGISRTRVCLPLSGRFNVENSLAALAAVLVSGASPSQCVEGLATVSPAPGRLESVPTGKRGFRVFVDYAHTEDALRKVLTTLRESLDSDPSKADKRRGRLICVFGCGGDRDSGKRAPMGRVVNELADVAVVTSDNPRNEDPAVIIDSILSGMRPARARILVEADRRVAIEKAVLSAEAGDVVLIAGKGHETTQTIGRDVMPFDDRKVAVAALP